MRYLLCLAPLLGFAVLLSACGGKVVVDGTDPAAEPLTQGIVGTVTRSTGDFMCCPSTGKVEPIAVPVHIIRGLVVHINGASPPPLAGLPVELTVQSGADGKYDAGLVPGTYTVFAEIDGELYHNCTSTAQPEETYCPTEVVADEFAKTDIDDSSDATF